MDSRRSARSRRSSIERQTTAETVAITDSRTDRVEPVSRPGAAGAPIIAENTEPVRRAERPPIGDRARIEEGPWLLRSKMPLAEIQLAERILSALTWHPNFGILLGVGERDEEVRAARRTLANLRDQAYGAWRVTILRRGRIVPERFAARLLEGFDDIAARIDICLDAPLTASLAGLVTDPRRGDKADLAGVLLAGDLLGCDAFLEMAVSSGLHPEAEFFYSDERHFSVATGQREAFFKPQWSPDLLISTNYIGRFWCTLPSVLNRAGATVGQWVNFGEYDLVLRSTEATSGIFHIPKLLCERGRPQLDHPDQEWASLNQAVKRRRIRGEVQKSALPGYYRVKRTLGATALVSIIIPTCAARQLIKTCIGTIRDKTAYRNFEIICVENIPSSQSRWKTWVGKNADKMITAGEPFNWSRFNNLAAREAKGEFLVFLNDDIEIIEPDWLEALLEHAQRPEVGVVGARLLYPDRKVQHAGIFWTPNGGRHAFRWADETEPGYFGLALTARNVLAVTGACLAMRRSEFEAQGGFDEKHTIINNDVDYCLRCWERGKSVIYTPYATLIHHELASREALGEEFDSESFERRWSRRLQAGDPFYHPNLSRDREDYSYDPEPLELVYSSHPLFDTTRVRSILAVKLDHIGDFITAIPALRRLRQLFPKAQLYLLTAPGSAALCEFIPGVAEVIEFEFFFARSGLGQRPLSAEDYSNLRKRLEPYRFDLAIDLRKWPETRPILQLTGARWFAGFDHNRQFPWLDIVMEWEQDPSMTRKGTHVSDDLMRLIDAVAAAGRPNTDILRTSAFSGTKVRLGNASRRGHTTKKLVCVHPGVGSPIRQWPSDYFAALIDRLVAAHDVEILLIGTREEAEIAKEVSVKVQRSDAVRSLVGEIPLAELPAILVTAALFVGNNSGPKHLAAALGVPTVGIHSGTVDAREWGPIGANAVAIRRNMTCSPCYLSEPSHCPRGLDCLTELKPSEVFEICSRLLAVGHGN
jgi:ADP-heptose:LPS heptosyltransferase/GT2 family glycosyltransferase